MRDLVRPHGRNILLYIQHLLCESTLSQNFTIGNTSSKRQSVINEKKTILVSKIEYYENIFTSELRHGHIVTANKCVLVTVRL